MADTLLCPSCQATLRLPPAVAAVRCPKCKTVIELAPAKTAAPLPFGKPVAPPPQAPVAIPAPLVPAGQAAKRGRVVRERILDEDELQPPSRRKKRSRIDDEDDDETKYGALTDHCWNARVGLQLLSSASVAAGISAFSLIGFLILLLSAGIFIPALFVMALFLQAVHWLLGVIGFSFALAGPPGMRGMAGIGLGVLLLHAAVFFTLFARIEPEGGLFRPGHGENTNILYAIVTLETFISNMAGVTDLPWMFAIGSTPVVVFFIVFAIGGGILEFAKISALGVLANAYAAEAKDPELGYMALRFVYRIIWLLIVAMVLKFGALISIRLLGGDQMLQTWFRTPLLLFTNGYMMWLVFSWLSFARVLKETRDILVPDRFADKRARLEG